MKKEKKKRRLRPWVIVVLAVLAIAAAAAIVYMLHTAIFGLNYYAGELADDIHLDVREYSVTELKEATVYYRDIAGKLAHKVARNADGTPKYPSFEEMAEQTFKNAEKVYRIDNNI